jgi:threonine/homoserine/homoserine lactone efflux protein
VWISTNRTAASSWIDEPLPDRGHARGVALGYCVATAGAPWQDAAVPTPQTMVAFAAAAFVLIVIPGPAVTYIVARSITGGPRTGVVSALGVATGVSAHVIAAAVGVSAVLARSALAFSALKYVGAAYLIAVGARKVLRPSSAHGEEAVAVAPVSLRRAYGEGILVNVFNPKTALFFLAFLPQFLEPARGPVAAQVIVLGLLFAFIGVCSDSTWALAAGSISARLRRNRRREVALERGSGAIFVGLGVLAALTHRSVRSSTA